MKICFLGYNHTQTKIIGELRKSGHDVEEFSCKITDFSLYDRVISFGYRHILKPNMLMSLNRPALNLHISFLPFNRGAHPSFWSFIENTPSGVTIHEIDHGIDTGPVCFQQKMTFDNHNLSFSQAYMALIEGIEKLFIDNMDLLISGKYEPFDQVGDGSYHNSKDLPKWMDDWDMSIAEAIAKR